MCMVVARHGIWQCPFCDNYQIWKTRNQSTIKLDRQCEKCHTRARVTIDRSNTGQGRNRSVNIWERPITVTNEQLTHEITQRNKKLLEIDHLGLFYLILTVFLCLFLLKELFQF